MNDETSSKFQTSSSFGDKRECKLGYGSDVYGTWMLFNK